jgi:hypothetical protein
LAPPAGGMEFGIYCTIIIIYSFAWRGENHFFSFIINEKEVIMMKGTTTTSVISAMRLWVYLLLTSVTILLP